ncbi:hypothetical protein IPZ58_05280 [Streptomyces roseoverticillatus]|uniref:hypothetical protein n=1 Tax=Streptomyces roseoverticillatus TaxID=66429 RepID=UPI001F4860A6|nr:hypothetical protein [Streptomyces roseoverticillatus]MCF3100987.1 hypothetical protein [Streptomyces roseoverticillatus]
MCFTPLNAYYADQSRLSPPEFIHPDRDEEAWDHEPQPTPVDSRVIYMCDFCSQPGGTAHFRTRKTVFEDQPDGTRLDMGDDWSACETCAKHIRSRSPHLLIDRAVAVTPGPLPGIPLNRPMRRLLRREYKARHMKFFEADPIEISEGEE